MKHTPAGCLLLQALIAHTAEAGSETGRGTLTARPSCSGVEVETSGASTASSAFSATRCWQVTRNGNDDVVRGEGQTKEAISSTSSLGLLHDLVAPEDGESVDADGEEKGHWKIARTRINQGNLVEGCINSSSLSIFFL